MDAVHGSSPEARWQVYAQSCRRNSTADSKNVVTSLAVVSDGLTDP
jgi:hypothetical protein